MKRPQICSGAAFLFQDQGDPTPRTITAVERRKATHNLPMETRAGFDPFRQSLRVISLDGSATRDWRAP